MADGLHIRIMAEKHPKRPRDLNQWAKRMVEIATGDGSDREPTPQDRGKDPVASAFGKLGASEGGRARADNLSAERRSEIARAAAKKRWDKL